MHEKLKETESLVWKHVHPWPSQPWLSNNSIEKGQGECSFIPDSSSPSNICAYIIFLWVKFKGRESLGRRLYRHSHIQLYGCVSSSLYYYFDPTKHEMSSFPFVCDCSSAWRVIEPHSWSTLSTQENRRSS